MCVSLAPPMSGVTNDISQSFVSPCASRPRTGWRGENWFRDQSAIRTGSNPPSSLTPTPSPPASLSASNGGGVSVFISGRQIIRLLLLPDIKNIRQAGRADTTHLLEPAGNHFRQVNPPPLGGQLGTRKTVGGAGGSLTPSDTFRPAGGRYTDRPDEFGTVV